MGKEIVNRAMAATLLITGLSMVAPVALAQSVVEQEDRYVINAYREKRAQCALVQGKEMMQCYADLALMQPKYKSAKARLRLHTADAHLTLPMLQVSS